MILITALFVVSEGSGGRGDHRLGRASADDARGHRGRLLAMLLGLAGLLAAVITPNGAIAALVPVAVGAGDALGDGRPRGC